MWKQAFLIAPDYTAMPLEPIGKFNMKLHPNVDVGFIDLSDSKYDFIINKSNFKFLENHNIYEKSVGDIDKAGIFVSGFPEYKKEIYKSFGVVFVTGNGFISNIIGENECSIALNYPFGESMSPKGISGGPAITVSINKKENVDRYGYHLVGIQSSWDEELKIARVIKIEKLLEIM